MSNIAPEFSVHMLNEQGKRIARDMAEDFDELLTRLKLVVPPGRYLSVVQTKLEEACFFAKKGMASQEVNQQKEE
ncbi:MAG TPA: hypothetical protein VHL57_08920 [Flavobacteriales bacterium]|jgi:hypothetical protein|nr:hypothetical protein [Flavobacteriales bacterium]